MSQQTNPAALPPGEDGRPRNCRGRKKGLVLTLILVLAAGITGAIATKALSEGFGPGPWHRGGFMGGPVDPARVIDHADRAVRHLAIEIDATGEQQDQLRAIVKSAVDDILPMRDKVQAARQQARDLLTRPAVDRAEIERLRSEQVGLADAFSRRVAQALGDAAEILTPEQRRKINDLLPPAGGYWRGWHRG